MTLFHLSVILTRVFKRWRYLTEFLGATFHQKINLPERLNIIFLMYLARYLNSFEELSELKIWQFLHPSWF